MKSILRKISVLVALIILATLCACSPVDTSSETENSSSAEPENKYENIEIPKISSSDTAMPTYFDISLYNVENYADIYLGKNFKFKITYAGNEISVPTTYKRMIAKGFKLCESEEYGENSVILAGKNLKAQFVNEYGNLIDALFYNASNTSVKLKDCRIVKFSIPENCIFVNDSLYGQFFVNGITNQSAITDVIEYLGAPSHFYAVNENEYYFDYFVTKNDLRSRITVYVNPKEDTVKKIEFSKFESR